MKNELNPLPSGQVNENGFDVSNLREGGNHDLAFADKVIRICLAEIIDNRLVWPFIDRRMALDRCPGLPESGQQERNFLRMRRHSGHRSARHHRWTLHQCARATVNELPLKLKTFLVFKVTLL